MLQLKGIDHPDTRYYHRVNRQHVDQAQGNINNDGFELLVMPDSRTLTKFHIRLFSTLFSVLQKCLTEWPKLVSCIRHTILL